MTQAAKDICQSLPATPAAVTAASLAWAATDGPAPELAASADLRWLAQLRTAPQAALHQACATWQRVAAAPAEPSAAAALTALLPVAEAQLALNPSLPQALLIDLLLPRLDDAGLPPALAARGRAAAGARAHERGDDAASLAHFAAARNLLQASGAERSLPMAMALIGQAAGWNAVRGSGDLARAETALDDAQAVLHGLGLAHSIWMSDVHNIRSVVAYARDDLAGALRWSRAEVALGKQLGAADNPEFLHALTTQGAILGQLNQVDEAQAALDEGLRIIAAHPEADPYGQQGIYSNQAVLLFQRGQAAQALPLADKAVQLSRQVWGSDNQRLVIPLVVRSQIEAELAQWAAARRTADEAVVLVRRHATSAGPVRVLRAFDALASALTMLGEPEQAQQALDEGLQIVAGQGQLGGYWRGRVLRRQALLAMRHQDWRRADQLLAEAEPLLSAVLGAAHPFITTLLAERCATQTSGAWAGGACDALQQQFNAQDSATPRQRYLAYAALAQSAGRPGAGAADSAASVPQRERELHLLALAAALDAPSPDPRWSAYDLLARHLRRSGQPQAAVMMAKQSVAEIERMRADLRAQARALERGFLTDKLAVYQRLADWLTEDGRIDEALQVLRLMKAEEYLEFLRAGAAVPAGAASGSLLSPAEQQQLARWQLGAAPLPLPAEGADKLSEAEREARRRVLQAQAQAQAQRVQAWQALLEPPGSPSAAATASAPPARARAMGPGAQPRGLPPPAGTLQAWLYPGEQHLNLVLRSARERRVLRLPISPAEAARRIGQLLADLGQRAPVDEALRSWHGLLGQPLAEAAQRAGAKRLLLQVSGALRYLPVAALHDGQRYLGERFDITQQVVGAEPLPPAPTTQAPRQVQAFGVTRALGGQAALPALAGEICGIVNGPVLGLTDGDAACPPGTGALPGQGWLNERFTRAQLAEAATGAAGRHDLLHLGTHFTLRPGHIGRSWLLLGDGQRLQLDEFARLDFSGQDLVTLSACETGLGGADAAPGATATGQELEGLNGVVMRRGARAVLASLWRVEDQSTGALMRAVYASLARHGEPARALREAQTQVRTQAGGRYSHPFYWAGFYLAGRP